MKQGLGLVCACCLMAASAPGAEPVAIGPPMPFTLSDGQSRVSGGFYYFVEQRRSSSALWRTDGTPEGTECVLDVEEEWRTAWVCVGETRTFFVVEEDNTGAYLHVVDHTSSAPRFVTQLYDNYPDGMVASGDRCFWFANRGDEDFLWVSDGTAAGTRIVRRFIRPHDYTQVFLRGQAMNGSPIAAVPGGVVLRAPHPEAGIELWFSDGTAWGTVLIADLCHPPEGQDPFAFQFSSCPGFSPNFGEGKYAYFTLNGEYCGPEWYYRTDGTPDGTQPSPWYGAEFNGGFYAYNEPFSSGGLYCAPDGGAEAYVCTVPGVRLDRFTGEHFLMPLGDYLYFVAQSEAGREIWRMDGTCESIEMVADLNPGPGDGVFGRFFLGHPEHSQHDGYFYYYGNDGVYGWQVWRAGGDPFGLERVTTVNVDGGGLTSEFSYTEPVIVVLNGRLLFWAIHPGTRVNQLWSLDLNPAPGCPDCPVDERVTFEVGSYAYLTVPESIAPEGPFQWYHEGEPVLDTTRHGAGTRTLAIPNVRPAHAGVYAVSHGPGGEYYVTELVVADAMPAARTSGLVALAAAIVLFAAWRCGLRLRRASRGG